MDMFFRVALVISIGATFSWPLATSAKVSNSVLFTSKAGFEVTYPSHWHPITSDGIELDILSSSHRVEGAVIPHGEAEIIVREIPRESLGDPAKFLSNTYDVHILGVARPVRTGDKGSGCKTLYRIAATFELAPGALQKDIFYVCGIGGRAILTSYTAWNGDKSRPDREKEAEAIARSTRIKGF